MMKLSATKSLRFWRYVDDMLLLGPGAQTCMDAVDGTLRPRLRSLGMRLKAGKTVTADLNAGETIEVLGLVASLQDGQLCFQAPAASAEAAAAAMAEVKLGEAPLHRARLLLDGLLAAYAPVLGEDEQFGRELRQAVLDQCPSGFSQEKYRSRQKRAVSQWRRILSEVG